MTNPHGFNSKRFMSWVFHGKTSIQFNHAQTVALRGKNKPKAYKFCGTCFEQIGWRWSRND
jgi:hypothetical protein